MGLNAFDDAVEQVAGTSDNPFDDVVRQSVMGQAAKLRSSTQQAQDTSPDQAAEALKLATRYGLPSAVVGRNLDTFRERARQDDASQANRAAPKTTAWMAADPLHAAVASDDLEPLTTLERTIGVARNVAGAAGAGVMDFSRGIWGAVYGGAEAVGATGVADFARGSAAVAEDLATRIRGPQAGAGFIEHAAYSGLEAIAEMVPALIAGAGTGAAGVAATFAVTSGGESYARAREEGASVRRSQLYAGIQATIAAGTTFIPAHLFLGDLAAKAPLVTKLAHQIVSALPAQEVQTALADLTSWALLPANKEKPFSVYLAERPSAAAASAIAALTAVGAQTVIAHSTVRVLDHLGAAARDSKAVTRAPEAVRDLIDQAAADGGAPPTVYLPFDKTIEYFQSKGIDPAAMATRLTGDPNAYTRARETGEDLAVPMGRYVTEIAATDHHAFFQNEARLQPDELNARESAEVLKAAEAKAAADVPPNPAREQIRQQMLDQLVAAQVPRETAEHYARLIEAGLGTMGESAGVDPFELFQRYGVQVDRPGLADANATTALAEQTANESTLHQSATPPPDSDPLLYAGEERRVAAEVFTGEERRRAAAPFDASGRDIRMVEGGIDTTDVQSAAKQLREEGAFLTASQAQALKAKTEAGRTSRPRGGMADLILDPFGTNPPASAEGAVATGAAEVRASTEGEGPDANSLHQATRGAITIGADRSVRISLFEHADLSTFLHESGHFFLEVFTDLSNEVGKIDVDKRTSQQQQLLADRAALDKFLADADHAGPGLSTKQHETFARSFEAYLFEGKAPSLELQSAFARFRAWLLGVYRQLRNLDAPLTNDVRGVFDRMLASDRAIADAEAAGRMQPLFTDAAQAGMSPEAFDLYRAHVEDASRRAREELDAKLLSEVRRTQQADYKAKREAVQTAVTQELQGQPVYQALAGIRKGTNADGSPIVEGADATPLKLSRQLIVERYGEDRLKALPKPFVYTREGGLDPDLVASRYGFSSGDELLQAITDAPAFRQAVEQQTERRMLAQYGSLLLDGTLPDAAQEAVANAHRDAVVRAEIRALRSLQRTAEPFEKATERAGADALKDAERERAYERRWLEAETKLRIAIAEGRKQAEIDRLEQRVSELRGQARGGAATIRNALPSAEAMRNFARDRIATTRVADLQPALFWSAARRAGQSAVDAAARQEFDGAISAKTSELVNLALYRQAERAKADVDTRVERIRALANGPSRQRLGLAGEAYLDQVDGVLDRYDFAKASEKVLDRRVSILKFAEGLESQGLPVNLPDELLNEARRIHYSRLTYAELTGVSDGLAQIAHLARLKNRLLKAQAGRELQETAGDLTTSIGDHATTSRKTGIEVRGPGAANKRNVDQFFASHRKLSSFVRHMDGFKDGGLMWEHILRPLNEAADAEAVRNEQATKALTAIFEDAYQGQETGLYHKAFIPAIHDSLSKMARLMVALNWGNEGNRERIRSGYHWTDEQVQSILGTLDARDAKFVQQIWDHIDSYWPEIEAKQKRVEGVAPEKVAAASLTLGGETLRGGYFPIKYEGQLSARAASNLEATFADGVKQAAYVKATTNRGHTKERVARVSEPVRLDFGVITDHVQQVIHDLTHHETLIDVGRLLAQRDVADAIYAHYGDVVYDQMKGAVRDIAFGNQPAPGWYKTLNAIRARTVTATLGWNTVVSLLHTLQITRGMVRVGPGWVAHGLSRWLVSARNAEQSVGWIEQQSDMMRLRWKTQQRELNEVRNQVGLDRGKVSAAIHDTLAKAGVHPDVMPEIADTYFYAIRRIVQFAEIPTWIGAYEKAMADPVNDRPRAIALADQAVIDSMGSGHVKDLAAVQRAPMARLLTTFYDYHNSVYNQAYELVKSSESPGRKLVDATLLLFVPVALAAGIHHVAASAKQQKADEKRGLIPSLAYNGLDYALGMFVGLRELSGAFAGGRYEGPSGLGMVPPLRRAMAQTGKALDADASNRAKSAAAAGEAYFEAGSKIFGFPARQVEKTAAGIQALWTGKTHDPSALLFGPKETK